MFFMAAMTDKEIAEQALHEEDYWHVCAFVHSKCATVEQFNLIMFDVRQRWLDRSKRN